jgi:N-acetylneuraminic acid mutarotase
MANLNGTVYLTGGQNNVPECHNETWTYRRGEWTLLTPATTPDAVSHSAMVVWGGKLFRFGGWDGIGYNGNTWTFDGTDWTQEAPDHSPSARFGHTMVVLSDGVYLFGGETAPGTYSDELWKWDGVDWTRLAGTHPAGRCWHQAAALSSTEMLVWGGYDGSALTSVHRYGPTGWTTETPLPAALYAAAYCGQAVRDVYTPRNATGAALRGAGPIRGCNLTVSERDAMIAAARKWKGTHCKVARFDLIMTEGGWTGIRGPLLKRGVFRPRGGRVIHIDVGEYTPAL